MIPGKGARFFKSKHADLTKKIFIWPPENLPLSSYF